MSFKTLFYKAISLHFFHLNPPFKDDFQTNKGFFSNHLQHIEIHHSTQNPLGG